MYDKIILVSGGGGDRLGDFIQWLHKKIPVYGYLLDGEWWDLGDVESYKRAVESLSRRPTLTRVQKNVRKLDQGHREKWGLKGACKKLYKHMECLCLALKAFLVRVFGRVQRVGYRRFVLDSAQELGLSGYVRNERDGSVTVFVQGDDAAVEKFIEMLKSPPQPAYVRSVDIKEVKPKPRLKYFAIKPSPLHEELQEGFGAMQSIFMDYWGNSGTTGRSSEDL
jgi:acylphosphatase